MLSVAVDSADAAESKQAETFETAAHVQDTPTYNNDTNTKRSALSVRTHGSDASQPAGGDWLLSPLSPFETPSQLLSTMNNMHTDNTRQTSGDVERYSALHNNDSSSNIALSSGLCEDVCTSPTIQRHDGWLSGSAPVPADYHRDMQALNNDSLYNIGVHQHSDNPVVTDWIVRSSSPHSGSDTRSQDSGHTHSTPFRYLRRSSHSTASTLSASRQSSINRSTLKSGIKVPRTASKAAKTDMDGSADLSRYKYELQSVRDELAAKDVLLQSKVEQVTELTSQLLEYQQQQANDPLQSSDDEIQRHSAHTHSNKYSALSTSQRLQYQAELQQLTDDQVEHLYHTISHELSQYIEQHRSAVDDCKQLHKLRQRYHVELCTMQLERALQTHTISPSRHAPQFETSLLHQKCQLQKLRQQYRSTQKQIRTLEQTIPTAEQYVDQLHSTAAMSADKHTELLHCMAQLDQHKQELQHCRHHFTVLEQQIVQLDTSVAAQQQIVNQSMDVRYIDYQLTQREYDTIVAEHAEQQQLIGVTEEALQECEFRLPHIHVEHLQRQHRAAQHTIQQLHNTLQQLQQQAQQTPVEVQAGATTGVATDNSVNDSVEAVSTDGTTQPTPTVVSPTPLRQRMAALTIDTGASSRHPASSASLSVVSGSMPPPSQPVRTSQPATMQRSISVNQPHNATLTTAPYLTVDLTPLTPFSASYSPSSGAADSSADHRYKLKMEAVEARIKSEMDKLIQKRSQLLSKLSPRPSAQTDACHRPMRIKRPSQQFDATSVHHTAHSEHTLATTQ